jgi:replicative DNA helicase
MTLAANPQTPPPTTANVIQGIAPPHSLEAEQSVLGAVLLSDQVHYAYVIEEGLRPEDFYVPRHQLIYESILELYNESQPVDVLTVTENLKARGKLEAVGGGAEVDALTAAVPAVGNRPRAVAAAQAAEFDV